MDKAVVFDIDNCLANFEGRLVDDVLIPAFGYEASVRNRDKYNFEDRWGSSPNVLDEASNFVKDPNSYFGLPAIESMIEFASVMEGQGVVLYVSARPVESLTFTERWLRKQGLLSNPTLHSVFCGVGDKAKFLGDLAERDGKYSIDFIVEDNPKEIEALKENFTVLTFDRPWNRGFFPRVGDVRGVLMYSENKNERAEPLYEAFS